MDMLRQCLTASFLMLTFCTTSLAQQQPGECVSDAESELLDLVNAYRNQNGLASVPHSAVLNTVAQWHAQDAVNNPSMFTAPCNLHSWSNDMPTKWSQVCYTSNHAQAQKMWDKPREISNDTFTGNGYENAAAGYASPTAALTGWKNSSGHNAVILSQDIWARLPWKSIGVGIRGNYYYLWFSDKADNSAALPPCSSVGDNAILTDNFE